MALGRLTSSPTASWNSCTLAGRRLSGCHRYWPSVLRVPASVATTEVPMRGATSRQRARYSMFSRRARSSGSIRLRYPAMPAIAMPACSSASARPRIVEALLDEVAAELHGAEPEAAADGDHLVPVGGLAREDAETRPLGRPLEPRHDGAHEGEVAADELGRARRRLQHDPALVADLVERPRRLGEVDAAEPRRAVADLRMDVLHDAPA